VAYGYTVQINGRQERKFDATWSPEQARDALAARILERDAPPPPPSPVTLTFDAAAKRYLLLKVRKKSLLYDRLYLDRFTQDFGADTPLTAITAGRISEWKEQAMARTVRYRGTEHRVSAATVNRPLAVLRHLLKIAEEEWEVLEKAPRLRQEREPEGRIRWLEPDEEARLLAACRESRNPYLAGIVELALESGMRRGEIKGLTWEQSVDLTRGVFKLEQTKGRRRREVPMRQAVYNLLVAMPARTGRVWPDSKFSKAFDNALKVAGITNFTFHDCRHHFASWFVMRGGSLQALKEILGHRDIKMTLRYAHLSSGHLRTEIERTSRQVSTKSAQTDVELADRLVSA
jgi:integrase